jgi:hypothetical protein
MTRSQHQRHVTTRLVCAALVVCSTGALIGTGASAKAHPKYAPTIDPADFVAVIDNPYLPLAPGARWVYETTTASGTERNVVEVTNQTRAIMGVTTVVVHDTVAVGGVITEDTFDWYAQDQAGNVWYFGEDTREFEHGIAVSAKGSWEGGIDGAQPGIVMKAAPAVGDRYRQEYDAGNAEDKAKVLSLDATVTVPFGRFDGVLVTRDYSPLEPTQIEHKSYARGIGVVREELVMGGTEHSVLVEYSSS